MGTLKGSTSTSRVPHFKLKVFLHRAWHLTNQNQRTIRKGFTKRDWAEFYLGAEGMVLPSTKAAAGTGDYDMLCGHGPQWLVHHKPLTIWNSYLC
jgi:hypothetical protein